MTSSMIPSLTWMTSNQRFVPLRELNGILEFNREHLQFPELEKICSVQKKIKQVKDEYEFYDPEYERSVMFPNGEDEEEDDFAF